MSRASESLRAERDAYRILVEGITDYAVYMLDPDGQIASWNPGAQRFKGYRADEIIGQNFSSFYTNEDREKRLPQHALETAAREGRFENEGWRVRKDGTRFWAHVIIDSIKSPQGELIGFAKITRDLTQPRETQRQLDLARDALVQAQKIEAIGQLTGGMAHDFNNLLSAILGSLDLAQKQIAVGSPVAALVRNAHLAAQRGAALTQRMLAFARKQDLQREPVDVVGLVHGMSDLLQRSIGPSVIIEMRFPLNLPPALADQNQLETALLNLAVNGRDAMPEGGPLIISGSAEAIGEDDKLSGLPAGRYIRLAVIDAGEGMDEETLSHAREPFFTTKGVGKGTGLGLSMVHGFAEQSGGRLKITSEPRKGTVAEIWLPVASAIAKPEPVVAPQPVAEMRSLRILAVDDDVLVLMNTAAMLADLGHTVTDVASAHEALDVLKRGESFDLVISDQAMPRMTGLQLANLIRSDWPATPIILATGYSELPGEQAGKWRLLSKPFTQQQLERAVRDAVSM